MAAISFFGRRARTRDRAALKVAPVARVAAPTLLIVGREDTTVLRLNQQAMREMTAAAPVHLETIHGATHLFEEPGALEEVSRLAADWFSFHLGGAQRMEGT